MDTVEYVLSRELEYSNPQLIMYQEMKRQLSLIMVFFRDNKDLEGIFKTSAKASRPGIESWLDH